MITSWLLLCLSYSQVTSITLCSIAMSRSSKPKPTKMLDCWVRNMLCLYHLQTSYALIYILILLFYISYLQLDYVTCLCVGLLLLLSTWLECMKEILQQRIQGTHETKKGPTLLLQGVPHILLSEWTCSHQYPSNL